MAALQLIDIRKSYGEVETLHGVNLEIHDGEFVVFVGPSGCGKSTLMRTIAGLEDISAGELRIGGARVNEVPPAKRGVAMVFQSYALYPHMTVAQNMAFGLRLAGSPRGAIDEAVARAARILRIEHLLERKPRELSGGQRQRVAIGRAIVRKPEVFLFDEPLSNLDAALRVQMRIELAKLHRDLGTTMIYVTHDQVEAMTLADRIVVLSAGRIEQVGEPLALYDHPANLFVAGFIGSPRMNFLDAQLESADGHCAWVRLEGGARVEVAVDARGLAPGAKLVLGVRPEHAGTDAPGEVNLLQGRVLAAEHLGDVTYLYLDVAGARESVVVRAAPEHPARIGDSIAVSLPCASLHLFDADSGQACPRLPVARSLAPRQQAAA